VSDFSCTVHALYTHPIKSCAGISVADSILMATGLDYDRAWMVVDAGGAMLTQREYPRLALVQPSFKGNDLLLRAPGMLALHLRLDAAEAPTRVQVWDNVVKAFDMGALAAQWFSDFLGAPGTRLVRFDPDERRYSDRAFAGSVDAENAFSDGFPVLVGNTASLADLNARLAAKGLAPVTMQRFRPNVVLHGLASFDEDSVHELDISTSEGLVSLRLVKPCARCTIPNVDPTTGHTGFEPGDTLASYRANPSRNGAITFFMNAVVLAGTGYTLRVGQSVQGRYRFS
jgi:uncharacterized protein